MRGEGAESERLGRRDLWSAMELGFDVLRAVGRVPGLALRIQPLIFALLAVLLLRTGDMVIGQLPFANTAVQRQLEQASEQSRLPPTRVRQDLDFDQLTVPSVEVSLGVFLDRSQDLTWQWSRVAEHFGAILSYPVSWSQLADRWTRLLFNLLVAGLCGAAVVRTTVLYHGGWPGLSVKRLFAFSGRHLIDCVWAPLLAWLGIVGIVCLVQPAALIRTLGEPGQVAADVWGGVALGCGFLITLIWLGVMLAWPLMIAAVGVEDSDGFDGFSRSMSYVWTRPAFLLVVIALVAAWSQVAISVAKWLMLMSVRFSAWSQRIVLGQLTSKNEQTVVDSVWDSLLNAGLEAYAVSLFWTGVTVVYLLVRCRDDGAPLEECHGRDPEAPREAFPVVGAAAADAAQASSRDPEPPAETTE